MATSFEAPIARMTVEAFRGFRDRQEFDLAASAVILAGPNGTGKTSFFDAIQWCLLGSIRRLEGLRSRRNAEHILNQYRLGDRAVVELELIVRGTPMTLRRTGDHRGSTLEFVVQDGSFFGDEAESRLADALVPGGELPLEMALTTSGLMQQDVMRAVLEAKPADRYRHVSVVLGLGGLEDFEEAAKELAAEAKARADGARGDRESMAAALSEARSRLAAAEQKLQTLPQVEALRAEVLGILQALQPPLAVDETADLFTVDGARLIAVRLASVVDALQAFRSAWAEMEASKDALPSEPTAEEIASRAAAIDEARVRVRIAEQQLTDVEARLSAARSASEELVRLASAAIPLLTAVCPVCSQPIDAGHVESELRARAAGTETMLGLEGERQEANLGLQQREAELVQAEIEAKELDRAASAWMAHRQREQGVATRFREVSAVQGPVTIVADNISELATSATGAIESAVIARRRVLEFLNTLEQGLDRGQVERAESEVVSFAEALEERAGRLEHESQRAQRLKLLADAAVRARIEVTEQRFNAVQPLVADIFSRLDPHPAFKTIEFELDTYYRRGATSPLVRDLVENVSADPLLVFSTSQANIAALSYFLAMGWSAGDRGLPFVLLDDPVQSMDDVNVLGFADLARHLRRGRQLLMSTHERRLARLLERKLTPRAPEESTIVLEFQGWDRSGPTVEQRRVEPQLLDNPIRVVDAAS